MRHCKIATFLSEHGVEVSTATKVTPAGSDMSEVRGKQDDRRPEELTTTHHNWSHLDWLREYANRLIRRKHERESSEWDPFVY